MKRKKYAIAFWVLVICLISGCNQKHKEGEPDVISSIKTNLDEKLIVVANRDLIEKKEEFAELIVEKCKDNSFKSIKLSTDYGYATSLNISVFLWKDQVGNQDPVMQIEYIPIKWGQGYDIVRNSDKFQMYIDGELAEY